MLSSDLHLVFSYRLGHSHTWESCCLTWRDKKLVRRASLQYLVAVMPLDRTVSFKAAHDNRCRHGADILP